MADFGDASSQIAFFVKALFPYSPKDSSSIRFHQGDVIEVLTQLDSGWWDGIIVSNGKRGWFPSNYVTEISDDEARAAFPPAAWDDTELETDGVEAEGNANIIYHINGAGELGRAEEVYQHQRNQSLDQQQQQQFESPAIQMTNGRHHQSNGSQQFQHHPQPPHQQQQQQPHHQSQHQGDQQSSQSELERALLMGYGQTGLGEDGLASFSSGGDIFSELAAAAAASSNSGDRATPGPGRSRGMSDSKGKRQQGGHVTGGKENVEALEWAPRQMPDGRIFYENPATGERSWDMPSSSSNPGNAPGGPGTSSTQDLMNSLYTTVYEHDPSASRGPGPLPPRKGSTAGLQRPVGPNVWIKKFTEDRTAVFFENQATKEVRWTVPEGSNIIDNTSDQPPVWSQPQLNGKPQELYPSRSRSDSSAQSQISQTSGGSASTRRSSRFPGTTPATTLHASPSLNTLGESGEDTLIKSNRLSMTSDDLEPGRVTRSRTRKGTTSSKTKTSQSRPAHLTRSNTMEALEPLAPPTLVELEDQFSSAMGELIEAARGSGQPDLSADPLYLDESIDAERDRARLADAADRLVKDTRALMHVTGMLENSAIGPPPVASSLASKSPRSSLTTHGLVPRTPMLPLHAQAELRPHTLTVISTLSKLMLSVRAVWGLLETHPSDHSMENEQEDQQAFWERRRKLLISRKTMEAKLRADVAKASNAVKDAVQVFQQEYERIVAETLPANLVLSKGRLQAPKRIQGVLRTSAGALILPGAGYGGNWRGNGFVTLPSTPPQSEYEPLDIFPITYAYPSRSLATLVVDELSTQQKLVEDLSESLRNMVENPAVDARGDTTMLRSPSRSSRRSVDPRDDSDGMARSMALTDLCSRLLSALAELLRQAEEIDIATRVDLDLDAEVLAKLESIPNSLAAAVPTPGTPDSDAMSISDMQAADYRSSVQQAKPLVADFERAKQILYEISPFLLSAIQGYAIRSAGFDQLSFLEYGLPPNPSQLPFMSPLTDAAPGLTIPKPEEAIFSELSRLHAALDLFMGNLQKLSAIAETQAAAPGRLRSESEAFRTNLLDLHNPAKQRAAEMEEPSVRLQPSTSSASLQSAAQGVETESVGTSEGRSSVDSTFFFPPIKAEPKGKGKVAQADSRRDSLVEDDRARRQDNRNSFQGGLDVTDSPVRNASASKQKLAKFFGEQPQGPVVAQPQPPKEESPPWFLGADYGPDDISFTMEGQVKGGTLEALVALLTSHQGRAEQQYLSAFLMTYKTFTTSLQLLDLLIKRYLIEPPSGLTEDEVQIWTEKKQKLIRFRVINVIRRWIDNHLPDDDPDLLQALSHFASHTVTDRLATLQLMRMLERRDNNRDRGASAPPGPAPPPIHPRNPRKLKFLDIDPLEMARQLTIMDSHLFRKITAKDALARAWPKLYGSDSGNTKAITDMSVHITRWVQKTILIQEDLRKRANTIKHFINIADRCRQLNNYATFFYIVAGLHSAPIDRLKRTWDAVNRATTEQWKGMLEIANPVRNFANYRDTLRKVTPPTVPFLGVYLTDWTFIGDGAQDMLVNKPNHINFNKRQKASELILTIQLHQTNSYNLTVVDSISKFINEHIARAEDEGLLYEMSLGLEPREREDEKIARLLQESGFL